jgi:hypothetical protein
MLPFYNTSMVLERTLNVTTNTLLAWHAPFAPGLPCMAVCTSSACAIKRLHYFVLLLNTASKCITNFKVPGSELVLYEDKCEPVDNFVSIRDHR